VDLCSGGASKHLRTTKPESADNEALFRGVGASDFESDALFDMFLFDDKFAFFNGGAYESLDSLFSADAVQGSSATVAANQWMGLWSFDNGCQMLQ
jgi:EREBP-like factor